MIFNKSRFGIYTHVLLGNSNLRHLCMAAALRYGLVRFVMSHFDVVIVDTMSFLQILRLCMRTVIYC